MVVCHLFVRVVEGLYNLLFVDINKVLKKKTEGLTGREFFYI